MPTPSRRNRHRVGSLVVLSVLVATLGASGRPQAAHAATTPFTDIAGTTFEADIDWLFAEGITKGCSATLYCPDRTVTRGEMASFLVRMFELTEGGDIVAFTDIAGTTHELEINKLAHAGITAGCTATTFCPSREVRRDEMASFLTRAVPLTDGAGNDYFLDDDATTHEASIDRAAAAGIASGCAVWRFCPAMSVSRGQMAGFLHRVVRPITPPLHPAPKGPQTLYVGTGGSDADNTCRLKVDPCRTISYALSLTLDGDTIEMGSGTFSEEGLVIYHDITIVGDPGGGTTIDAHGGESKGILTAYPGRSVTLDHLTLTGGSGYAGPAVWSDTALTIRHSTITDNTSPSWGGAVAGYGAITIERSMISGNDAGISLHGSGTLKVVDSTISGNTYGGVSSLGGVEVIDSAISSNGGPAIRADYGAVSVTGGTITGNASGIESFGSVGFVLTVTDTVIRESSGTAIAVGQGSILISRSLIAENGGGVFLESSGVVAISNSTVSSNAAPGISSGAAAGVTLTNSTISGNSAAVGAGVDNAGSLVLRNSLIAGNVSVSGPEISGAIDDQAREHRRHPRGSHSR